MVQVMAVIAVAVLKQRKVGRLDCVRFSHARP